MPPRSSKEARTLSSRTAGSDSPEPITVKLATPGEYPVVTYIIDGDEETTDYSEMSDEWKAAYDHAARHDNVPKACILWADAHMQDHDVANQVQTP